MSNDTGFLPSRIRSLATEAPQAAALISPSQVLCRSDLFTRVERRARQLVAAGISPPSVVAMTVNDEWLHLEVLLACVLIGVPTIGLPPFRREEQRRFMAMAADAKAHIVETQKQSLGLQNTFCVHALPAPDTSLPPLAPISPDYPAVIISTSGTTGYPKLFGRSHGLFRDGVERVRATSTGPHLRASTMSHDASRVGRLLQVAAGVPSVFFPEFRADTLAPFCERHGVREIAMGAYRLTSLVGTGASTIRLPPEVQVTSGGGRVPGTLRKAVADKLTGNLSVLYATSELGTVSLARPEQHDEFPEGLGQLADGVELSLRNTDGTDAAETGIAHVRKRGINRNYLTGQSGADEDGWFNTGDIITRHPSGTLIFRGRADDMMILNGINIHPGTIEDVLSAHVDVAEVAAFRRESRVHGHIPMAAVVLRPGSDTEHVRESILAVARRQLGVQAPKRIVVVDSLPRNEAGKVQRVILSEQYS